MSRAYDVFLCHCGGGTADVKLLLDYVRKDLEDLPPIGGGALICAFHDEDSLNGIGLVQEALNAAIHEASIGAQPSYRARLRHVLGIPRVQSCLTASIQHSLHDRIILMTHALLTARQVYLQGAGLACSLCWLQLCATCDQWLCASFPQGSCCSTLTSSGRSGPCGSSVL